MPISQEKRSERDRHEPARDVALEPHAAEVGQDHDAERGQADDGRANARTESRTR